MVCGRKKPLWKGKEKCSHSLYIMIRIKIVLEQFCCVLEKGRGQEKWMMRMEMKMIPSHTHFLTFLYRSHHYAIMIPCWYDKEDKSSRTVLEPFSSAENFVGCIGYQNGNVTIRWMAVRSKICARVLILWYFVLNRLESTVAKWWPKQMYQRFEFVVTLFFCKIEKFAHLNRFDTYQELRTVQQQQK